MRMAVCAEPSEERRQLCSWIEQYCTLYGLSAAVVRLDTPQQLAAAPAGLFQVAYVGFEDSVGFRAARALRERDRESRIILVADTPKYAIQGMHLHFTDFILRPVTFSHVARSLRLAVGRI